MTSTGDNDIRWPGLLLVSRASTGFVQGAGYVPQAVQHREIYARHYRINRRLERRLQVLLLSNAMVLLVMYVFALLFATEPLIYFVHVAMVALSVVYVWIAPFYHLQYALNVLRGYLQRGNIDEINTIPYSGRPKFVDILYLVLRLPARVSFVYTILGVFLNSFFLLGCGFFGFFMLDQNYWSDVVFAGLWWQLYASVFYFVLGLGRVLGFSVLLHLMNDLPVSYWLLWRVIFSRQKIKGADDWPALTS